MALPSVTRRKDEAEERILECEECRSIESEISR
jgi:hypothetical protein